MLSGFKFTPEKGVGGAWLWGRVPVGKSRYLLLSLED